MYGNICVFRKTRCVATEIFDNFAASRLDRYVSIDSEGILRMSYTVYDKKELLVLSG